MREKIIGYKNTYIDIDDSFKSIHRRFMYYLSRHNYGSLYNINPIDTFFIN